MKAKIKLQTQWALSLVNMRIQISTLLSNLELNEVLIKKNLGKKYKNFAYQGRISQIKSIKSLLDEFAQSGGEDDLIEIQTAIESIKVRKK